jgi:hypothetical protein
MNFSKRYAITFGEVAILHVGLSELGQKAAEGYSVSELSEIASKLEEKDIEVELINLTEKLPKKYSNGNDASVLIIRNGVNHLLKKEDAADKLYLEQDKKVIYDKRYFDIRRSKTLNKRARYNIVFGDEEVTPSSDYKQHSVKAFSNVPKLNKVRKKLKKFLGNKAKKLNAEGNEYYEDNSGIGFHGDAERKIVICLSLGKSSTLRYYWRRSGSSDNFFGPIDVKVNHGDIYVMSEKATGHDWKKRSKVRLVHAAGSKKYIDK